MSKTTNKFSPEVRDRAVRLVAGQRADYASEAQAMKSIAGKFGCSLETLRRWCREEASGRAGAAAGPVNMTACKRLFSLGCVAHTDGACVPGSRTMRRGTNKTFEF